MFKLSYSLNSAPLLAIEEVCNNLLYFGYTGVELSFQRKQFDPFQLSERRIAELSEFFSKSLIKPVCISTATTKLLSNIPHEPSLINVSAEKRLVRNKLIAQGLNLADVIGIPLVSFQSGYIRDEHAGLSRPAIMQILITEIKHLLAQIRGCVNLVIEPEPGMFIETISDARELIEIINDNRFGLHMDIGHVFCSEKDYIETIRSFSGKAKYIHIADIKEGFNLKYQTASTTDIQKILNQNFNYKISTLYDIDNSGLYLFISGQRRIFVGTKGVLNNIINMNAGFEVLAIDIKYLQKNMSELMKHEIIAYLDSISGIDYEILLSAYDCICSLRLGNSSHPPIISEPVCNTINGKVHYHNLFGNGKIDYSKVISELINSGYSGYCTVELYNHASLWRDIAPSSAKFVLSHIIGHFGWDASSFGHIDHRKVVAPYIRAADAQIGHEGGIAVLYDLRLCQPNTTGISSNVLHTLEHCFLSILPNLVPGFLGVAPMGCKTGLYITTAYPLDSGFMKEAIVNAFNQIIELDEVPYQNESLCGMAKNHNLFGAKSIARSMTSSFKQIDVF